MRELELLKSIFLDTNDNIDNNNNKKKNNYFVS